MSIVFSKAAGQVISLPDPTLPANISLRIEGWGGFIGFKSIVTSINVSARGNFQFLHTLGGQVFVYVFGERIGQLGINGLAFDSTCGQPAGTLGVERVLDYYSSQRIANRATPLRVTIGAATTLAGYLIGIDAKVADPKTRVWQFNLQLALIPDEDDDFGDVDEDTESFPDEEDCDPTLESGESFPTLESPPLPDTGGVDNDPGQTIELSGGVWPKLGLADPNAGPTLALVEPIND